MKGQAEIDQALNPAGLEQVDPPLPFSSQIGFWFDTDITCEEVVFRVGVANVFEGRKVVGTVAGLEPLGFYPVLADHTGELRLRGWMTEREFCLTMKALNLKVTCKCAPCICGLWWLLVDIRTCLHSLLHLDLHRCYKRLVHQCSRLPRPSPPHKIQPRTKVQVFWNPYPPLRKEHEHGYQIGLALPHSWRWSSFKSSRSWIQPPRPRASPTDMHWSLTVCSLLWGMRQLLSYSCICGRVMDSVWRLGTNDLWRNSNAGRGYRKSSIQLLILLLQEGVRFFLFSAYHAGLVCLSLFQRPDIVFRSPQYWIQLSGLGRIPLSDLLCLRRWYAPAVSPISRLLPFSRRIWQVWRLGPTVSPLMHLSWMFSSMDVVVNNWWEC